MKEWLYRAKDVAASGEPRPDYEGTRAFAVADGILCRSEYDKSGHRAANVQYVETGDVIHLFFRQTKAEPQVHCIGSFRVRDPGDARLNEECDLAVVRDDALERRLRSAYGIGPDELVTGWLLEPASDVSTPSLNEPEIAEFLSRRSGLVEYHGRMPGSDTVAKDRILTSISAQLPTLPGPLRFIHGPLLVTIETWSDGVVVARFPAARLYGEGHDDASAMDSLSERIAEFVETHLLQAHAGRLGGTLAKQWAALTAMVDVSAVHVPMEDVREMG
jgi:hypothetical protein